jgi:hypothetical protein
VSASYPFRGATRWLILPVLMTLGGVINGLIGWMLEPAFPGWWWLWAMFLGIQALGIGMALALGRQPAVALLAAGAFGAMSLRVSTDLITRIAGVTVTVDSSWKSMGLGAAGAGLVVLSHLVYLRARRFGWPGILGGAAVYIVAATAAVLLGAAKGSGWAQIGMAGTREGLFSWLSLAAAIRVSERAAPARND